MTSNPELSIIVVNWNVCDLLEACLASILQNIGLDPAAYEVHVFDNHSADGSVSMVAAKFPGFHLTASQENLGFGRANNRAYEQCRGDYILLLNPDAEIQGNAVGRMLDLMKQTPDAGILGARLVNTDGSFQRSSGGALPTLSNVAWHYLFLNQILPKSWAPPPTFLVDDLEGTFDIGWVSGAALMLRRTAAGSAIFDNQFFMYGEDLELCDRIQSSGWRVLYTSEATVLHHLRQSVSRQSSAEILASAITGNRAYFQIRHGRFKTWLHDVILSVGYLTRWVILAVLAVVRKDPACVKRRITAGRYAGVSLRALFRGGR